MISPHCVGWIVEKLKVSNEAEHGSNEAIDLLPQLSWFLVLKFKKSALLSFCTVVIFVRLNYRHFISDYIRILKG